MTGPRALGTQGRFLVSGEGPPSWNMAVDETLLEGAPSRAWALTLRTYQWNPPALSLGRFQGPDAIPGNLRGPRPRLAVRRPTGGGAILHDGDLCFSLASPRSAPLFAGRPTRSYERIARGLAGALVHIGIDGHVRGAGPGRVGCGPPAPFLCHGRESPFDIVAGDDRKLIGMAGRWGPAGVLVQGSIPLLRHPLPGVLSIEEFLGTPLGAEALGEALRIGIEEALEVKLSRCGLTPEEVTRARETVAGIEVYPPGGPTGPTPRPGS